MPFKSEKQRRFMWSQHPVIARRWAHESSSRTARAGRGGRKASFKLEDPKDKDDK